MMLKTKTLQDVLADEIRDLYCMETHQINAYSRMAKASVNLALRGLFNRHVEQTRRDQVRLEAVARSLEMSLPGKDSNGMYGLILDMEAKLASLPSSARDIQLVCLAQKMGHYKLVGYASTQTIASPLGKNTLKLAATTGREETAWRIPSCETCSLLYLRGI